MDIPTLIGECRTYSDRTATHDHSFAQLILPLQGTLRIEAGQQRLSLDRSRLFFLPPHCQHTFYAKDTNQFFVLDIPHRLLNRSHHDIAGGLSLAIDDRWDAVRSLFWAEVQGAVDESHRLMHLFHYAYGLLQRGETPRSIQFIRANFHQPIDLNQLAQLEGYTLTYYCEWFKKQTGTTPNAYLQSLRLERAKELLVHTDWTILSIAQQVGYEHHSSLTRLFQRMEKTTPIAYRQQIRRLAKLQQKNG
ncbi:AraC family transcriptional regulator [filamentous cyanobacterium CCP1]|nr:AraC family transcriptional regulator [filamentous cyanobacterium CCP2]PSB67443.1 AraC family transcriptional regulator [filamentous cyanobacterium CCP1]